MNNWTSSVLSEEKSEVLFGEKFADFRLINIKQKVLNRIF